MGKSTIDNRCVYGGFLAEDSPFFAWMTGTIACQEIL